MTNPQFAGHPFGTTVTAETLRNTFAPLTQWEDKYRQLIMLGKQLPALPDELKAQAKDIAGCENRVWLGYTVAENGKMHFFGDSEGRIVRGLLAVLLTAVEGKPPPSCRHSHHWHCLMSWDYVRSLAPHAARVKCVKRGDYRCDEAGLSTEPGRIRRSRLIRPDCLTLTRRFRHHLLQRMRNRNKPKGGGHHRCRAKSRCTIHPLRPFCRGFHRTHRTV